MARKNRRSKQRPQAKRRPDWLPTPNHSLGHVPSVETMVIPHGRCQRTHKLRFYEHEVEKALRQAQATRIARGQEAHMECRYYRCDDGCGDWHLTSRAEFTERATA